MLDYNIYADNKSSRKGIRTILRYFKDDKSDYIGILDQIHHLPKTPIRDNNIFISRANSRQKKDLEKMGIIFKVLFGVKEYLLISSKIKS